mgnify:CR=1 FL=1
MPDPGRGKSAGPSGRHIGAMTAGPMRPASAQKKARPDAGTGQHTPKGPVVQPVLRSPEATPLIDSSSPRCSRSVTSSPERERFISATWMWFSGSR